MSNNNSNVSALDRGATRPVRSSGNSRFSQALSQSSPRLSSGKWWKRSLFAVVAVAALAAVASFMGAGAAPATSNIILTHPIARGDLIVSVSEEGHLESSNNKEIKCRVRGGSTVLWIVENGTEVKPGDELVRLDDSVIEDNINAQRILYQTALAVYAQSKTDVSVARINIQEYTEGTFRSEKTTLLKDIKIAESQLLAAQDVANHSRRIAAKGYISKLQLKSDEDAVEHKKLELEVLRTDLDVLERYTKPKQLEELNGILKAKEAKLASDEASLNLEKSRLDRELQQLEYCVVRADSNGLVIYPRGEEWKNQPDIEEGATVREDQVLLIIPDLLQMQVKVGIHEANVDQIKPGMPARVQLQNELVTGEVSSIASVTRPAGWWNGNTVKYDTIIKLGKSEGLKPGMSAAVQIFVDRHENVLLVPVAAVVEAEGGFHCWVKTADGTERRTIELGDSDDQFIVVNSGLNEGDQVVLNPRTAIKEARTEALQPVDESQPHGPQADQPADGDLQSHGAKPTKPMADKSKLTQGNIKKPDTGSKPSK